MTRLSFKEYPCLLALAASTRSEDPDTQVGACVLNKKGRVLSTGYNGFKEGYKVEYENREDKLNYMIHAEINALSLCEREEADTIGLTISPCCHCALAIATWGIKNVYYLKLYHRETKFMKIFDSYGIKHEMIKLPTQTLSEYFSKQLE